MSAGATPVAASATTPSTGARDLSASRSFDARTGIGKISPHAKQILNSPFARTLVTAGFRLIQRVFIAEAGLWLTALVCALAGFPAVFTGFCVALVGFIVNCWLAFATLAPVCRKLWKGGRA